MYLNTIKAAPGSKKKSKRVGRGIGSTLGKTCGRGHKGQKSRSGGFHKTGFEGGQMPLQRRLPKVGFRSRTKRYNAQVCLHEISSIDLDVVDLAALKQAKIIPNWTRIAKVIDSGEIKKAVVLKGIKTTQGAQRAIEAAGGKIET